MLDEEGRRTPVAVQRYPGRMRSRRRTWVVGGAGLLACGVLGVLRSSLAGSPGAVWGVAMTADVIYAAAVLLFAVGASQAASVVARGPLGVTALSIVAGWPLADTLVGGLLSTQLSSETGGWAVYGYISLIVPVGAGLIAAMRIARAGTVPSPWCWAPLAVLLLQAAVWAIPQILFTATGAAGIQAFYAPFAALGMLGFLAHTLGLGILAVVLAARERPDSVEVYRSA